jgi:DNA-binding NtrC family response regulator
MARRILIVDDEPSIRKVLSAQLRRQGHDVVAVDDGAAAMTRLDEDVFHVVVSDLKMPQVGGLELLRWVRDHHPGLPVILITAHGTVDSAVEALKQGAFDYITKPFDQAELQQVVAKAVAVQSRNTQRLQTSDSGRFDIVGTTPRMREVFAMVERVAPSPSNVLICGESGTGKELVARALHAQSERAAQAFVQINCGAIPEALFEAELFGYRRGAFTGAVADKPGRFELAEGGTLFLDEVGELPLDMQVKLLRALQERQIDRVGGLHPIPIDVRVVAATNIDLAAAVDEGRFRRDLFYRLNVIPISLPPLRERIDDVPLLADHFLRRFCERLDVPTLRLEPAALAVLMEHDWPGNIRELENLMERVVLLADGDRITPDDLLGLRSSPALAHDDDDLDALGLKEYVRVHTAKLERARIRRVLDAEEGNVTRAAKRLGISRKSLQTKMKDYGLRDS